MRKRLLKWRVKNGFGKKVSSELDGIFMEGETVQSNYYAYFSAEEEATKLSGGRE